MHRGTSGSLAAGRRRSVVRAGHQGDEGRRRSAGERRFYAAVTFNAPDWTAFGFECADPQRAPRCANLLETVPAWQLVLPVASRVSMRSEANVRAAVVARRTEAGRCRGITEPGQSAAGGVRVTNWPGRRAEIIHCSSGAWPNDDGSVFVPISSINGRAERSNYRPTVAPDLAASQRAGGQHHGGIGRSRTIGTASSAAGTPAASNDSRYRRARPDLLAAPRQHRSAVGVWRKNPPSHVDPSDQDWIKGGNISERKFLMPMPDGWHGTPLGCQRASKTRI